MREERQRRANRGNKARSIELEETAQTREAGTRFGADVTVQWTGPEFDIAFDLLISCMYQFLGFSNRIWHCSAYKETAVVYIYIYIYFFSFEVVAYYTNCMASQRQLKRSETMISHCRRGPNYEGIKL